MIVRVNRIPDDINSRYATFDQMRHTEYAIRFNFLFRCICFKLDFNQTKKKKGKKKRHTVNVYAYQTENINDECSP